MVRAAREWMHEFPMLAEAHAELARRERHLADDIVGRGFECAERTGRLGQHWMTYEVIRAATRMIGEEV